MLITIVKIVLITMITTYFPLLVGGFTSEVLGWHKNDRIDSLRDLVTMAFRGRNPAHVGLLLLIIIVSAVGAVWSYNAVGIYLEQRAFASQPILPAPPTTPATACGAPSELVGTYSGHVGGTPAVLQIKLAHPTSYGARFEYVLTLSGDTRVSSTEGTYYADGCGMFLPNLPSKGRFLAPGGERALLSLEPEWQLTRSR